MELENQKNQSRSLIVALAVILAISLYLNAQLISSLHELSQRVNVLEEENLHLKSQIESLNKSLQTYEEVLTVPSEWRWLYAAGVYIGSSSKPEGMLMKIYVDVKPGSGKIFIATKPLIGIELQSSAEAAFNVVCDMLNLNRSHYDLYIVIEANKSVNVVDGPSAGATLATLIAAAFLNENLNHSIVATGTILPNGGVGEVGGIVEKAIAAFEGGAKVFAVPKGQTEVVVSTPVIYKPVPWITIKSYRYEKINLQDYLESEGYTLKVVEIESLADLLKLHGIILTKD
ncbi:MAG: hypothetical protein DRJ33_06135 [Candidatus Methanomethylicota archaeon]|uniref:Lon proteolytic domain-containing protein n=1 Tax=Thermoproteota archaeon TaxID=2056631 RepID=A0A497EVQ5_9CREN|nr:MAG: hypothetical protein DRJ33_06135 [Candidatus Verstraetearchaeota archaeon]